MTGRGRGRLLLRSGEPGVRNASPVPSDLADLFNSERTPQEVYKIVTSNILISPHSKNKLRSCLEHLVKNMIHYPTNAIEICKYLYVCSCSVDRSLGSDVWSQFYSVLEVHFKDIHGQGNQVNEDALCNFTRFFIVAVHFMRNPSSPPKDDILSAILILINKLKKDISDHRNLFCQAVAWMSSYKKDLDSGSVLSLAWTEALNQLREWILSGEGEYWALACLEAASSGLGLLPRHARDFYSKSLSRSHFSSLTESSFNILIPAVDKVKFSLPNIQSINYID